MYVINSFKLKELSDDKGKEISAIFNELEEKLKEKDALEDTVKKQVKSIQLLQDQLDTHNILNNTKDAKMNEREELLKKEIKKLQADVCISFLFAPFCIILLISCLEEPSHF